MSASLTVPAYLRASLTAAWVPCVTVLTATVQDPVGYVVAAAAERASPALPLGG